MNSTSRIILPFSRFVDASSIDSSCHEALLGVWSKGELHFSLYGSLKGRVKGLMDQGGLQTEIPPHMIKSAFPVDRPECYRESKVWLTRGSDGTFSADLRYSLLGGVGDTLEAKKEAEETAFMAGIAIAMEHAEKAKGKLITAVIGPTGAGKSVLVNQLLGVPLVRQGLKIVAADAATQITLIGNRVATSQTTYAQVYQRQGFPFTFADCGGFFDSRGLSTELVLTGSIKMTLEASRQCNLVFCIPYFKLDDEKSVPLFCLIDLVLNNFLKDSSLAEESLLVVFTKPPQFAGVNRDSAVKKLEEIYDDLEEGSQSKELVSFLLRDRGKYIAVYDPLSEESVQDLKDRIGQLNPIQNTKDAFRPAFSSTAMTKLTAKAFKIAMKGRLTFNEFTSAKEAVASLATALEKEREQKKRAECALDELRLNSNPEKARNEVMGFIHTLKIANAQYLRDKELLEGELRQLEEEISTAEKRRVELMIQMKDDILCWSDTFICEGKSEHVKVKKKKWHKKAKYADIPVSQSKTFSFTAHHIPCYSKVERQSTHAGSWRSESSPSDKKNYSVTFTTAAGASANATVSVFCKREHHAAVMGEYSTILMQIISKKARASDLKSKIDSKQSSIAAGNASLLQAENNLANYEGFKAVVSEREAEIVRLTKELEGAKEKFRVAKDQAEKFLQEGTFLKRLLNIWEDSELHTSEIVIDYLVAVSQVREMLQDG